MIDYKHVAAPARIPGESDWGWARRYAARFDPGDVRRIVLVGIRRRRRDVRKGRRPQPLWAYVMSPAGMGSTVASALVERYRDERALARVARIGADARATGAGS